MESSDRPKSRRISDGAFYFIAGFCGLAGGIVGAAFHLTVDALLRWPAWLVAQFGAGPETILMAAAIAAAGVLVAFLLTRAFAPEAAGSGVQEIEGAMEGLRTVRWRRILPVKFVGGVLGLSSGLVAGREGPTIHMGASIAAAIAEMLKLDRDDMRGLLAAGAAAGLAAAFNAPLAAILFIVEETRKQFRYTFRSYVGVICASAASAMGMGLVGGTAPPLGIAALEQPLWLLPAFVLLGVGLGGLGVLFNRCLLGALDWTAKTFRRVPFVPALVVGAAVGALAIVLPEAVGGGELLIPHLVARDLPLATLALVAVLRFVGTMASYPVGVPGGIFSPMLTLATTVGLGVAILMEGALASGGVPVPPSMAAAVAIAAMGGLFAATIRAPLVGVVLAVELTGAYALILPLLVTCVTAHVMSDWLGGRPIYEQLLERTLRLSGQTPPAPVSTETSSPVGIDDKPRPRVKRRRRRGGGR
ncbi:MAG: H(+)/Cl(-) exchange transporter ClcA [Reyranella sp.]|uniref:H(+)/Cl(-) exchange transporter ClcA n=1 Tax=Reyranella sp. TaxID=1929291 RepID=UPI002730C876|nr:H(+)/Cl(-) exchange transporter ClcA [Reyranella sp.]MDP1966460.1 H(+)/Cl(-) exchange transporter ClcA [Reyranella sp.]MDP2372837.1 H(+)/Cl(-) exchange transporter ClcA [Reyranella sp.]